MPNKVKHIGLTGATGFVGTRFITYNQSQFRITALSLRGELEQLPLAGMDAIVHLAGKAHATDKQEDESYFQINTRLTQRLAAHAKQSGVPHFIFMSSVKVYGEGGEKSLNESSVCHPRDAYGKSKLEAENQLFEMKNPSFHVSVVRASLVYGPGVKGNLLKLLSLCHSPYLLPFKHVHNKRSMVFLDQLIELFNALIEKRESGIFLAADDSPLSTEQLVTIIRKKMGKSPRLISVPSWMRGYIKRVKPGLYDRLFGSFLLDDTQTRQTLGLTQKKSPEEGLSEMIQWFLA